MFETCEREIQEYQEFLEDSYKSTCDSLEKNQKILSEVEAGILELDPSEGIDHVKSIIESLTKSKELLEVRLGKRAPRTEKEAELEEPMKTMREGITQLTAKFKETHDNVSRDLAEKIELLKNVEAGTAELDPSETIKDLRENIEALLEIKKSLEKDLEGDDTIR